MNRKPEFLANSTLKTRKTKKNKKRLQSNKSSTSMGREIFSQTP